MRKWNLSKIEEIRKHLQDLKESEMSEEQWLKIYNEIVDLGHVLVSVLDEFERKYDIENQWAEEIDDDEEPCSEEEADYLDKVKNLSEESSKDLMFDAFKWSPKEEGEILVETKDYVIKLK